MVSDELDHDGVREQLEHGFVRGWKTSAATNTTHLAKIYRQLHQLNSALATQVFGEVDILITPALPMTGACTDNPTCAQSFFM